MTEHGEHIHSSRTTSFIRSSADTAMMRRSMTRGSHYSHASVGSWVNYNLQNPPPPPVEPIPLPTPVRGIRPLPNPKLHPQQNLYVANMATEPLEGDDDEYITIDPDVRGLDLDAVYRSEGLAMGRGNLVASPTALESGYERGNKSFVGGFVRGLKRLPRRVLGYGGAGEKQGFLRRGTFGTEGTVTSGTGNTLPQYTPNASTPVVGGSSVPFAQSPRINEVLSTPQTFISGPEPRRRHPSFRIIPPSDEVLQEEEPTPTFPNPHPEGRATMMVYQEQPPTIHEEAAAQTEDLHVSYASHTPVPGPSNVASEPAPVDEPVSAHPLPATDYMKMTFSPSPTSRNTMDTTSYEPSFSSELNPVYRFFHTLYHMPWIAHERVTVDYRPGNGIVQKKKTRPITKKSWYRGGLVRREGTAAVDLLSNGTTSARTSAGTDLSPVASPTSRRTRRRTRPEHHHHHRHSNDTTPRRRQKQRASTSTANTQHVHKQRSMSPLIPPVYPYNYPAYPYPYPGYSLPPPPRGPRSHRSKAYAQPQYPIYQPMPAPPPGPVYVFQQPAAAPAGSTGGVQMHTPPGQMLYMQMVPGAFSDPGASSPPLSPRPAA